MENNKICSQCGVENNSASKFCKMCGSELKNDVTVSSQSETVTFTETSPAVEVTPFNNAPQVFVPATQTANADSIKGIQCSSIKEYMGRRSEKLYNKYIKYCDNRSVWNWPVFFFSLLGIPFVWFYYRKLYKVGTIVLAIWFALAMGTAVTGALALNSASDPITSYINSTFEIMENWINAKYDNSITPTDNNSINLEIGKTVENLFTDTTFIILFASNMILAIGQLIFIFVLPYKANRYYYCNMENNLRKLKENNATDEVIRLAGGTNVSVATVCGFAIGFGLLIITKIPVALVGSELIGYIIDSFVKFMDNIGVKIG